MTDALPKKAFDRLCGLAAAGDEGGAIPVLDRYDLGAVLGEGAVGIVYRATDRDLNRPVAVKFLKETLGNQSAVETRFQREAEVAAGLSHPNIITVHDVGKAGGRLYLVMELVEGLPLDLLLKRERGDRARLVGILEKVANGVGTAHEKGIVHRDLKPSNILVTEAGEPKVGDFGLAHVIGADAALTRTGTILGTPLYMAPEQVRGEKGEISPRTDVFALGAILYEILTGFPPHAGQTTTEIYGRIIGEDPRPPRHSDTGIPRDLETITLKALEKDPSKRYPTARQFAQELRRFLNGEPILARPPGPVTAIFKRIRRHPTASLTIAFLVIASVAAAGLAVSGSGRAARDRETARLMESGRLAVDRATLLLRREKPDYAEVRRRVDEGRRLFGQAVERAPQLPMAHYLLGRACLMAGEDREAESSWRTAIDLDGRFAPARFQLGRLLLDRVFTTLTADTPEEIEERRPRAKQLVGEAEEQIGAAVAGVGMDDPLQRAIAEIMLEYARGDFDSMRAGVRKALDEFGRAEGVEDLHSLDGLCSRSPAARAAAYTRALEINPHHLFSLCARSSCRRQAGDIPGATADLDRALQVNPRLAGGFAARAALQARLGENGKAEADIESALKINPELTAAWLNRAVLKQAKGDRQGAMEDFNRALAIDPRHARALAGRAALHAQMRNAAAALADCDLALQISPGLADAWSARSSARLLRDDFDGALADIDKAVTLDPRSPMYRVNRAVIRLARKDSTSAIQDLDEVLAADPRFAQAWLCRGLARSLREEFELAIRDFEKALEVAPADWQQKGLAEGKLAEARSRLRP